MLGTHAEELSEGELSDTNGNIKCLWWERWHYPQSDVGKNWILKQFSEIFGNIKRIKDQRLEVDLDLGVWNVTRQRRDAHSIVSVIWREGAKCYWNYH